MSIVVYYPFGQYDQVLSQQSEEEAEPCFCPAVDVLETPQSYEFTVELPGVARDEVEVALEDGVLRIAGNRKEQKPQDGKALVRSERAYGRFSRSFSLPEGVDSSKAEASFKDGVLTVSVSKGPEPQKRTIEVKAA